jgi:hypothetical protein
MHECSIFQFVVRLALRSSRFYVHLRFVAVLLAAEGLFTSDAKHLLTSKMTTKIWNLSV